MVDGWVTHWHLPAHCTPYLPVGAMASLHVCSGCQFSRSFSLTCGRQQWPKPSLIFVRMFARAMGHLFSLLLLHGIPVL